MEIQGYPNYLIYPDGRVFSKKLGKCMKQRKTLEGYWTLNLKNEGKRASALIHRLVAIHYIPNPENKPEVDHINRIRHDYRIENLRWVTSSENNLNTGIQKRNNTGFKWITKLIKNDYKNEKWITHSNRFSRKFCKTKQSKSLPKLLCYSFFYLLKHPLPTDPFIKSI